MMLHRSKAEAARLLPRDTTAEMSTNLDFFGNKTAEVFNDNNVQKLEKFGTELVLDKFNCSFVIPRPRS